MYLAGPIFKTFQGTSAMQTKFYCCCELKLKIYKILVKCFLGDGWLK